MKWWKQPVSKERAGKTAIGAASGAAGFAGLGALIGVLAAPVTGGLSILAGAAIGGLLGGVGVAAATNIVDRLLEEEREKVHEGYQSVHERVIDDRGQGDDEIVNDIHNDGQEARQALDELIADYQRQHGVDQQAIAELREEIHNLTEQERRAFNSCLTKDIEIVRLKAIIEDLERDNAAGLDQRIERRDRVIHGYRENTIPHLQAIIANRDGCIQQLRDEVAQKNLIINNLNQRIRLLEQAVQPLNVHQPQR